MNWFAKFKLNTSFYPDWIHLLLAYGAVVTFGPWAAPAVVVWALWVELWFDPREERGTSTPNLTDVRDIADYLAGMALGLGALAIKARI